MSIWLVQLALLVYLPPRKPVTFTGGRRTTMPHRLPLAIAFTTAIVFAQPTCAQSISNFYAGKTVKIVIGADMGGEHGIYSQLIAQQIAKFVPGKPTVIVQPMPGAGGIAALNHLANV